MAAATEVERVRREAVNGALKAVNEAAEEWDRAADALGAATKRYLGAVTVLLGRGPDDQITARLSYAEGAVPLVLGHKLQPLMPSQPFCSGELAQLAHYVPKVQE